MKLPKPFLGRALIEAIQDDAIEYKRKQYGMENSKFILPEEVVKGRVPLTKGKILAKAEDFCGEYFQSKFGALSEVPQIGDIVFFIPNETFAIDPEKKYHLVNDCDLVGNGYIDVEVSDEKKASEKVNE